MLGARSHDAGQHSQAAQANQPAVTLPIFITDALSYEASFSALFLLRIAPCTTSARGIKSRRVFDNCIADAVARPVGVLPP